MAPGSVGTGHVERLVKSVAKRLPVRVSGVVHQAAEGAGHDVLGNKVSVWAGLAEGSYRGYHQPGVQLSEIPVSEPQ